MDRQPTSENFQFNAAEYEPVVSDDFSQPIPPGDYTTIIHSAEIKQLKSGNGFGLSLGWQVVDGQYKGRMFWELLLIGHTSPDTAKKAKGMLSARCRVMGVTNLSGLQSLKDKAVVVRVKIKKSDNPDYPDKNEITSFPKAKNLGASPKEARVDHSAITEKQGSYTPASKTVEGHISDPSADEDDIPF